ATALETSQLHTIAAMMHVVQITVSVLEIGKGEVTWKFIEELKLSLSTFVRGDDTCLVKESGMKKPRSNADQQEAQLGRYEPGMMLLADCISNPITGQRNYLLVKTKLLCRLKNAFVTVFTNSAI